MPTHRAPSKIGDKYTMGKMKIRDDTNFLPFDRWLRLKRIYVSGYTVLYTDWSRYISFTGIIWTVLWREQISMALHYWKISGNLTVLSFFFFFRSNISKFPYRGNRVTFPQKRKHISKCSHEIPARSLHAILNFIACRVFNLNVVSVSCIGNAKLIKSE